MAGISNIIGAYNLNPRRVSSKLSFEVGQVFAAKIVSASELNKELVLRLLDGWQFPAKLENPLDFIPEGLIKFQVDGFQDGKLQIKIVNAKKEDEELKKSSIEDLLSDSSLDVDKEDISLLNKMVKHNMPLTKENISRIKTIIDFKEKINKDSTEEEAFINKYIGSKGIDANSPKGKEIQNILKGFFSQLKNTSEDDILTMMENGVELTEDNIKSFNKLFKEDSTIYKELNNIGKEVKGDSDTDSTSLSQILKKINSNDTLKQEAGKVLNRLEQKLENSSLTPKELELYEGLKKVLNEEGNALENFEKLNTKDIENAHGKSVSMSQAKRETKDSDVKALISNISEKDSSTRKQLEGIKAKDIIKLDNKEIENIVKEQLSSKTEELKDIIKTLLRDDKGSSSESYGKVLQTLKESINDFKVFNSVSNQYYYMDVPVNINKDDYQCKLLIKDDRKSGKKIDSKNVSLVVSVKTTNIGLVDAYVKVRDKTMSVDIKCEEDWIKLLSIGKDKILGELTNLGYSVFMNVEKREIEANLVNCRDFFEDGTIGSINTRV